MREQRPRRRGFWADRQGQDPFHASVRGSPASFSFPHVRGNSKPHNAESLHVHIYRLRNKLAPYGIQIETMVNVGYRLVPTAEASERRRESA